MTWILLGIFVLLFSLGTWLSALIAVVLWNRRKKISEAQTIKNTTLDILIPAHHEKESLPVSLEFFNKWRAEAPPFFTKIGIKVALSNWPGPEGQDSAKLADDVLEVPERGKWKALQALLQSSSADWIVFADSGTIWQGATYKVLQQAISATDIMALNPTYLEKLPQKNIFSLIWGSEKSIKTLENSAGGPISLHGATIFYRRAEVEKAFDFLGDRDWQNDDLVVPLALRVLNPQMRVFYSSEIQSLDCFPSSTGSEMGRRKRILLGNIQWVQAFLTILLKKHSLLFFLALRRVSRMVWAWWVVVLAGAGLSLASEHGFIGLYLGLGVLCLIGLLSFSTGWRLLEAFWVSLCFPLYLISYWQQKSILWK